MTEWLALGSGVLAGAIFAFIKLPIPAPPSLAGLLGVVGITVGYMIVTKLGG